MLIIHFWIKLRFIFFPYCCFVNTSFKMDDVSTLKVQLDESVDNEEEDDIDKDENYLRFFL